MEPTAAPTPITRPSGAVPTRSLIRAARLTRTRSASARGLSESMAPARASSSVPTREGIRSARQAAAAASATSRTRAWADRPSTPGPEASRSLSTIAISRRPSTGTPSALDRTAASAGSAWAWLMMPVISVRWACRSRLSACLVSRRPSASVVAARSMSTVSVPPGGPSQTRITRPQSSPRAPTGVNSHPAASS